MPKLVEVIEVAAAEGEALEACRTALLSSGWEIAGSAEGGIRAHEDVTRLDCRTSPTELEITVLDVPEDTTALSVRATAPGVGPIPGPARLRRQVATLGERIRALTT